MGKIKSIKLTNKGKVVIEQMRGGWTLRWQQDRRHEPFIEKRGELDTYIVPVKIFYDLIEGGYIKARSTRSIAEYYDLTELGKTISI